MVKKRFLLLIIAFLMIAPCVAMQMAQQTALSMQALDETSTKELIKKLLGKKYNDMVSAVSKLSYDQKESIKGALNKNYPLFTPQVRLQQVLSNANERTTTVAFSPDNRFVLTGSWDNVARLWDLTSSPLSSQKLSGHSKCITSVAFSPDGRFALTGSEDHTARLWDLTQSPISSQELIGHTSWITSVAFSPNGHDALTGSQDTTARLWNLTQSPITSQELTGHSNPIKAVCFSPNGHFALTRSFDWTARLWDLTKAPICWNELGDTAVIAFAFSPDSRFALTGSKTVRLWDLTKSPITNQILQGHDSSIESAAFSPDGRFALTGSSDHTGRLWNLTQSPITSQELNGHTDAITLVAFNPDGRFALTGACDKTARLWDLTKSPFISHELKGHADFIVSIVCSADGRFALTGSWDSTARLWDLTKSPISSQELTGNTDGVRSVAFSPNNRFVSIRSYDTAILWKFESVDSAALALEDLLLIIKLIENEDLLNDDPQALERLELIMKEPEKQCLITKLIADYSYRAKLPEKECWICSEKYDPEARICMQLICCKKTMCKVCLDKLGGMTYSTEFEGYQFQHTVKAKCPFCNKPADQMGTIKKFKIDDPENHHCSSCDKEKCTLQCGACKTEYYCSKECQAKDWPNHKNSCKKK